jgi:hypothetical protein
VEMRNDFVGHILGTLRQRLEFEFGENVRRSIAKARMNEIDRVPLPLLRDMRRRTMDDADLLRNRATRLFALAEKARQQGHPDYADELTSLAREVVRHAVMIGRRFRTQAA